MTSINREHLVGDIKIILGQDFDFDASTDIEALMSRRMIPRAGAVGGNVLSMTTDVLNQQVGDALKAISDSVSSVEFLKSPFAVTEVRFTLAIDASGEIGLLSAARGSMSGGAGLEFTLTRKT